MIFKAAFLAGIQLQPAYCNGVHAQVSIWSTLMICKGNPCAPRLKRHLLVCNCADDAILYTLSHGLVNFSTVDSIVMTI